MSYELNLMTIKEALNLHEDSLILLSFVLGKDKAWILANQEINLTIKQFNNLTKLINKRNKHYPLAYLTGEKEFYALNFKVTPDVLIPRPESELLVEKTLDKIKNQELRIKHVIDVGTGSGNLIISIAVILERAKRAIESGRDPIGHSGLQDDTNFVATDISGEALKVAKQNAKVHKVSSKIKFLRGNLLEPALQPTNYNLQPSIILANLPYLSNKQLNNLTIKHEPKQALDGGADGLNYFKELFKQIKSLREATSFLSLRDPSALGGRAKQSQRDRFGQSPRDDMRNITLFLEHGPAQKKSLTNLAKKYFPKAGLKFHKDLSGKWRVLEINI